MWAFYKAASALALALGGPWLLLRRGRHYLPSLKHRLGWTEDALFERPLWIHAVSVGEAGVAAILARALPASMPLLVTTVTPTGQMQATALLGDRAQVTYLPFELGFSVRRFFRRYQPSALILAEGDLWPLVLHAATEAGIPVAMVSGRISDRSFARLRRFQRWLGPLLDPVHRFGMQTEDDRQRLLQLGVEPHKVETTGNLKFEIPAPDPQLKLEKSVINLARDRSILIVGSTMKGEEAQILSAFELVGGGQKALLVLAPRHPERWDEVAELLRDNAPTSIRRSELENLDPEGEICDILLLDSLGELAGLYRLATAVFIGGTLVPTGGHNPLEAAVVAAHIAVGPSMENFREIADSFDRAKAWDRVANAAELAAIWRRRIAAGDRGSPEGQRAFELVESNRGSMARTLEMLKPLLEEARERPRNTPSPPFPAREEA